MGLSQEEEQGRRATNHTPVAPDAGRVSRRRQTFGSSLKPSAHRSQERGHLACWLSGLLLRKHWVGSQPRGWGGGVDADRAPPPAGLSPAPLVPICGWQAARKQLRAETLWGASWPGCGPRLGRGQVTHPITRRL